MLIDVNALTLGNAQEFLFEESISVKGVPVDVKTGGSVAFTKEGYVVSGDINAVLNLKCDLCLEKFTSDIKLGLEEIFSNSVPENDEKEYWPVTDKAIDLRPAVEANILLNMPMKAVCSENCKGLCPVCGKNLNKGDCGCDREYSNPVFEQLMTLFEDNKDT